MGAAPSSSGGGGGAGVLGYDAVPDPSHPVLKHQVVAATRGGEPEPEPEQEPQASQARPLSLREQQLLREELQRLQEELQEARRDAQKAERKAAKKEARPELVPRSIGAQHQRTKWEHADWARGQITQIYRQHRPEKLPSVDSLMTAWLGAEEELLAQIQAKYQPDSESVVVRKLKDQVEKLRDERELVRSELHEQREGTEELAEAKTDLQQGWNSALKTLELERAEHEAELGRREEEHEAALAALRAEQQRRRGQVVTAPPDEPAELARKVEDAASKRDTAAEATLQAELSVLQEELRQAKAQAALAQRERTDAEVKAIALEKSMQRSNKMKRLASPPQRRRRRHRSTERAAATQVQYQLFQTFAGDSSSAVQLSSHARANSTGWPLMAEQRKLSSRSRWAQTWDTSSEGVETFVASRMLSTAESELNSTASALLGADDQQQLALVAAADATKRRQQRLVAAVPQRTLSGKYGGITWSQSWHDSSPKSAQRQQQQQEGLEDATTRASRRDRSGSGSSSAAGSIISSAAGNAGSSSSTYSRSATLTAETTTTGSGGSGGSSGGSGGGDGGDGAEAKRHSSGDARPSSADIMLRWAAQEQVEGLAPTASAIPFVP